MISPHDVSSKKLLALVWNDDNYLSSWLNNGSSPILAIITKDVIFKLTLSFLTQKSVGQKSVKISFWASSETELKALLADFNANLRNFSENNLYTEYGFMGEYSNE